jgi:hypothetical protein
VTDRIACCIPGCRRTRPFCERISEWICQSHWSRVPRDMRRVWSRAKRRLKSRPVLNRIWQRCKAEAIAEHFLGMFP